MATFSNDCLLRSFDPITTSQKASIEGSSTTSYQTYWLIDSKTLHTRRDWPILWFCRLRVDMIEVYKHWTTTTNLLAANGSRYEYAQAGNTIFSLLWGFQKMDQEEWVEHNSFTLKLSNHGTSLPREVSSTNSVQNFKGGLSNDWRGVQRKPGSVIRC